MFQLSWRFIVCFFTVLLFVIGSLVYAGLQKIEQPIILDGHYKVLQEEEMSTIQVYYIVNKNDLINLYGLQIGEYFFENHQDNFVVNSNGQPNNIQTSSYYGVRTAIFELQKEELQAIRNNPEWLDQVTYRFSDGTEVVKPLRLEIIDKDDEALLLQSTSWGSDGHGDGNIQVERDLQITNLKYHSGMSNVLLQLNNEPIVTPINQPIAMKKGDIIKFAYEDLTLANAIQQPVLEITYKVDNQSKTYTYWHSVNDHLSIPHLNNYVKKRVGEAQ